MAVDSLGFGEGLWRPARAARRRARARPARSTGRCCPTPPTSTTSWCSAWAAPASPATWCRRSAPPRCRCRSPCSSTTARPRSSAPRTLAFAVSYSGDTEETVEMARGALGAGAHARRDLAWRARSPRLAQERGALHVPCPDDIPLPRLALGALVAPARASCCSAWACCPRRTPASLKAQQQLAASARPVQARRRCGAQPGA